MADSFDGTPYSAIPAVPDTSGSGDSVAPEAAPPPTAFEPLADAVHAFLDSGVPQFTNLGEQALVAAHPRSSQSDSGQRLSNISGELSGMIDEAQVDGVHPDGSPFADLTWGAQASQAVRPSAVPPSAAPAQPVRPSTVPPSAAPAPNAFESPQGPPAEYRPQGTNPYVRPRPEPDMDSSFLSQDRARLRRDAAVMAPLVDVSPAPPPLPPHALPRGLPLVRPPPGPLIDMDLDLLDSSMETPPMAPSGNGRGTPGRALPQVIEIGSGGADRRRAPSRRPAQSVATSGQEVVRLRHEIDEFRNDAAEYNRSLGEASAENRALCQALQACEHGEAQAIQGFYDERSELEAS